MKNILHGLYFLKSLFFKYYSQVQENVQVVLPQVSFNASISKYDFVCALFWHHYEGAM